MYVTNTSLYDTQSKLTALPSIALVNTSVWQPVGILPRSERKPLDHHDDRAVWPVC